MPRLLTLPAVLLLLSGLFTSSCRTAGTEPDEPGLPFYSMPERTFRPDTATREAALALLRTLDAETLRAAYGRLADYRYTAHTRTDQIHPSGRVVASETYTIRHDVHRSEVLARRDSGTFNFGLLGRFVASDHALDTAAARVGAFILPDDPAYRSPRHREAYTYTLHTDTSLRNRPVRVLTVRSRPRAEGGLPIRYARFYVDAATQALTGLDLVRVTDTWLFDEASRFTVHLRPAPDGAWMPYTAHFRTRLQLPLRPSRRFRTTTTYFDYAPATTHDHP